MKQCGALWSAISEAFPEFRSVESFPPRQASVASEYTSSVTLEAELSTPAAVAQRAAHQEERRLF